jgi:hypothetical protein
MHKATHVLIAEFYRDNHGISRSFAKPFGVSEDLPSAWGRPKASDTNPTGTGKGNPLDQGERFLTLVHPIDPARSREMAENFVEKVDELDRAAGVTKTFKTKSPAALFAESACEHADIAVEILQGELDLERLLRAKTELRQAKGALLQLEGSIDGLIAELSGQKDDDR